MKIAVFGASVSAQTVKHATGEVTGYAEVLRRDHAAELGAGQIRQITYPGNRLSDGGLLRLAEVLAWKPDICLFEPLIEDGSRGKPSREAEKRHVYISMLEAGILPVTLLLPNSSGKPASGMPHYNQFVGISRQYGLPVIEITLEGVTDLTTKFDGVHTLQEGARIYARQIVAKLKALGAPRPLAQGALARALERGPPTLTLTTLPLPAGAGPEIEAMEIALSSEAGEPLRIRLVQKQKIGPFSPVLDVTLSAQDRTPIWTRPLSVWDAYCHYSRDSFVMLADVLLDNPGRYRLSLKVSETLPDYAQCRRDIAEWPKNRTLMPLSAPVLIADRAIGAEMAEYRGLSA